MQFVLIAILALQGQQEPGKLKLPPSTTDEQLAVKLKGLTKLTSLNLSNTKITDAGLAHLKGLTNLEKLWLYKTNVTDAGLAHLKGFKKLNGLNLSFTLVTDPQLQWGRRKSIILFFWAAFDRLFYLLY